MPDYYIERLTGYNPGGWEASNYAGYRLLFGENGRIQDILCQNNLYYIEIRADEDILLLLTNFAYLESYLQEIEIARDYQGNPLPAGTRFTIPQVADPDRRDFLIRLRNDPDSLHPEERRIGEDIVIRAITGDHKLQIALKDSLGQAYAFTFNQLSAALNVALAKFNGQDIPPDPDGWIIGSTGAGIDPPPLPPRS